MPDTANRRHADTTAEALQVSDPDLTAWLNAHAGDGPESRHATTTR